VFAAVLAANSEDSAMLYDYPEAYKELNFNDDAQPAIVDDDVKREVETQARQREVERREARRFTY